MAIDVRIPTILRTYTDGAKQVEGTGSTLGEVFTDLGEDYLLRRYDKQHQTRRLISQLEKLGYTVELTPAA